MNKRNIIPPKLASKLLSKFLRTDLAEEVRGDLEEKFYCVLKNKSLLRAKLSYWYEVINYLRPFAIRKSKSQLTHYDMFENYFKIGWRNLIHQKTYSAIKIGGFAVGIAACLLIACFIRQELLYDRQYPDGDRIYRVLRVGNLRGETSTGVHFPAPFSDALRTDYPDFEEVGRYSQTEFFGAGSNEIRRADQLESTHEEGFIFMDQSLLNIFQYPFIYGNSKLALKEPNTMVITKSKADKYFPHEDPIGKIFIINNDQSRQYTVTGVIEDVPVNSHLQFDFVMTLSGKEFYQGEQTNWQNGNYPTYVRLRPGAEAAQVEEKIMAMISTYLLPGALKGSDPESEGVKWTKSLQLKLQPVQEIYLNRDTINEGLSHGDIRYIGLFGAIAFFILVIACVNFINLSTAKSANRAREVGLRKVVGSLRGSLVNQFLTESLLFSFFSVALGLFMAWAVLPFFSSMVAKPVYFPWTEWWLVPALVAGAVAVGLLAGIYPAIYLSSFRPAEVLKGNVSRGSKNSTVRSGLVVFQFTISIVLIIGTFIIDKQMKYVLTKKLGYDKDQILLLQGAHTLGESIVTLKNELLRLPDVKSATISGYLPVDLPLEGTKRNGNAFFKEGGKGIDPPVGGQRWQVDHDYIKTIGLKLLKGRDFAIDIRSDSQAVVINQAMAEALHLEDPIGKNITNGFGVWPVIGVVEDFHYESMREHIQPLCLVIGRSPNIVAVKINSSNMPATIEAVSNVWKKFSPNQAVRYSFLDQQYARMHEDVERMGLIFTSFALLAIVIACLGLFALSAFMVEQRGKEISIRLVLGASVNSIFGLLTMNFVKLVIVSLVIAIPLAIYLMEEWLKDFVYKIEIGWEILAAAGLMSILVAVLTISYQSIRAALINPVENLKSE